ncbi:MAG TPA: hypothetical protein VM370_12030 [Candidatus Thermoplasmatota archaeon]|nr:hypothetical protein [Candidatus Thermoplasmatota archaeon]
MRRGSLALALALFLALPVAAADHVFSHRVYVVGRVLDPEGRPAAGVEVNLTFEGIRASVGCFDNRPERTGPRGDYEICRHTHSIPANATVTVRVGELSRTVPIDPDLRHAVASFQLNMSSAHDVSGERQFARTFTVTGRAFALLAKPIQAEAVEVNATPLIENVTVELRVLDRVLASKVAPPNEHGLFMADLEVTDIPAAAIVRASAGRDFTEEPASALFRRADVNVLRDVRLLQGPGDDAPGSAPTPSGAWPSLLAVALTAWAAGSRASRRRPP